MKRLSILVVAPLLLAFAPVPALKPMTDAERAVEEFAREVRAKNDASTAHRKRRLVTSLELLRANLLKAGKTAEAEVVRERLVLLASIDGDKPWGNVPPAEMLKRAALDGKYRHLLHVVYAPGDRTPYNDFNDFGHWPGTSYLGQTELNQGHWVYLHPRWFVWREGPSRR
jgi:hypothetical protein